MIDSLNALQSYLDTLQSKGFSFDLINYNNQVLYLTINQNHPITRDNGNIECYGGVYRIGYNQEEVSQLLEEVEEFVESKCLNQDF